MTGQTAGEYVDDSTITTQVKAKLVGEKTSNLTRIDVDTTNRVVSLNGIVESPSKKPGGTTGQASRRREKWKTSCRFKKRTNFRLGRHRIAWVYWSAYFGRRASARNA